MKINEYTINKTMIIIFSGCLMGFLNNDRDIIRPWFNYIILL